MRAVPEWSESPEWGQDEPVGFPGQEGPEGVVAEDTELMELVQLDKDEASFIGLAALDIQADVVREEGMDLDEDPFGHLGFL